MIPRQAVAARAASNSRCLYREDLELYTTMGIFGILQPFSHFLTKMPAPRVAYGDLGAALPPTLGTGGG